jgi:superfamily I DNA and/or RNA helicase
MPWIQSTKNLKVGEQQPGYHNVAERGAVLAVLHLLTPRDSHTTPSLAVITPYAQQVTRLSGAMAQPRLQQHLKQFRAASHTGQFVGTVDSFQGNEADVVVLSLVRNNRGGALRSSLGFLADPRRMNVMLSRARWRMVIVGSRRFLQECALSDQAQSRGEQTPFLPELLAALTRAEKQGCLKFVPASVVIA